MHRTPRGERCVCLWFRASSLLASFIHWPFHLLFCFLVLCKTRDSVSETDHKHEVGRVLQARKQRLGMVGNIRTLQ
jgi:hypothetical protein